MKALSYLDKKKREVVYLYEEKKLIYSSLKKKFKRSKAKTLSEKILSAANKKTYVLPRDSSLTRIRNRCIMTARSRSVTKFFKISRTELKKQISMGNISGVQKDSW